MSRDLRVARSHKATRFKIRAVEDLLSHHTACLLCIQHFFSLHSFSRKVVASGLTGCQGNTVGMRHEIASMMQGVIHEQLALGSAVV